MLYLIALATFCTTILGGLFALRLKDRLHLILGFSAGAVIGVAFFDLIPEAMEIGTSYFSISAVSSLIAIGFVAYMLIDRIVLLHDHSHDEATTRPRRGVFGALSLSLHSFLDGIGVGFAFQISTTLGAVVAVAVLAHNFSDGINTVNFILKNGGGAKQAFRWLLVDACAPLLGILSTLFFSVSEMTLGIVLALFAGSFLYIGASDLLPESHHEHPVRWTTFMTVVGIGTLYVIIQLAGM